MVDGLNDLYVHDKQDRDIEDFDGSGKGTGKFSSNSERKNNLKSVSIFILLEGIAVVLLILSLGMCVRDVNTRMHGKYIIAENAKLDSTGEYRAQYDGKTISFSKGASVIANKDGTLKVYYSGNSFSTGSIMMYPWEYAIAFVLIIAAIALFTWKIYKGMHVTNHSAGAVAKGKFDE